MTHIPGALSLTGLQRGPYDSGNAYASDSRNSSVGRGDQNVSVVMRMNGKANDAEGAQRRQGESCEWPRACEWPMKERRGVSEIAQDAMADAAAAAAISNSMEWTQEAKVYTMNEELDADLPPDVELLAYFSDSPIAWRAHEHYSEEEEGDELGIEGRRSSWQKALGKWFSKMWRYQGLG